MARRRKDQAPTAQPGRYAHSQNQLSLIYGFGTTRIQEVLSIAGLKRGPTGREYDLYALGRWFKANSSRFSQQMDDVQAGELAEWALREKRADALTAELKLVERRDLLCIRDEVNRTAAETVNTFRLLLSNLPTKCAVQVPPGSRPWVQADVAETVDTAIRTVKKALAVVVDPENPIDLPDALGPFYAALERLPAQVGGAIRPVKQRKAVEAAAVKWVERVKTDLAEALEGETQKRQNPKTQKRKTAKTPTGPKAKARLAR